MGIRNINWYLIFQAFLSFAKQPYEYEEKIMVFNFVNKNTFLVFFLQKSQKHTFFGHPFQFHRPSQSIQQECPKKSKLGNLQRVEFQRANLKDGKVEIIRWLARLYISFIETERCFIYNPQLQNMIFQERIRMLIRRTQLTHMSSIRTIVRGTMVNIAIKV